MSTQNPAKVKTSQAFEYHWMIWKLLGLCPPNRDSKWFKIYIVYAIIINMPALCLLISFLINLILSQNMIELCENVYNTTSVLFCNIKFFYIIFVMQKLRNIHLILNRLDLKAKSTKEVVILKEGISSARNVFINCARILFCAVTTSQLLVCVSSERTLMYPVWLPWDWKASKKNFLLANSFQFFGISVDAMQNVVNDTYPPAYFIILSAHIKALAARIKDLGSNGTTCEETLYEELTECIKDHNTIYELFLTIQGIISITCFFQFAATGLAQCTMGVYFLYVDREPLKLLNLLLYFSALTTEIFILCYYGDLYCQANAHLTESIYACNWVDRSEKFKKAFLFLLTRSQVHSVVMAGNLIPVQMPTFVKVMKTAYSVFTVLSEAK